jgi:hypothetical protein
MEGKSPLPALLDREWVPGGMVSLHGKLLWWYISWGERRSLHRRPGALLPLPPQRPGTRDSWARLHSPPYRRCTRDSLAVSFRTVTSHTDGVVGEGTPTPPTPRSSWWAWCKWPIADTSQVKVMYRTWAYEALCDATGSPRRWSRAAWTRAAPWRPPEQQHAWVWSSSQRDRENMGVFDTSSRRWPALHRYEYELPCLICLSHRRARLLGKKKSSLSWLPCDTNQERSWRARLGRSLRERWVLLPSPPKPLSSLTALFFPLSRRRGRFLSRSGWSSRRRRWAEPHPRCAEFTTRGGRCSCAVS